MSNDFDNAFEEAATTNPPADVAEGDGEQQSAQPSAKPNDADTALQQGQNSEGVDSAGNQDYDTLMARYNALDHSYKSVNGRIAAYQKQYEESRKELEALKQSQQEAQQQAAAKPPPPDPASTPEQQLPQEWSQMEREFPEIAKAIEARYGKEPVSREQVATLVESKAKEITETRLTPIEQAEEQRREAAEQVYLEQQYAALQAAHPDWQKVARSAEFKQWVAGQPEGLREMINSVDAGEASALLDLYKAKNPQQKTPSDRTTRLRRAALPRNSGAVHRTTPMGDFDAAWDEAVRA
jgi:chromosome segregation ATPase